MLFKYFKILNFGFLTAINFIYESLQWTEERLYQFCKEQENFLKIYVYIASDMKQKLQDHVRVTHLVTRKFCFVVWISVQVIAYGYTFSVWLRVIYLTS